MVVLFSFVLENIFFFFKNSQWNFKANKIIKTFTYNINKENKKKFPPGQLPITLWLFKQQKKNLFLLFCLIYL